MTVTNWSPGWNLGYVPTPGEWNAAFAAKIDGNNGQAANLSISGGTLAGSFVSQGVSISGSVDIATITSSGLPVWTGSLTAGRLLGNPGSSAAVPSAVIIGSGLSLSSTGTLSSTVSGGPTSIGQGSGISVSGSTVSLASISTATLLGNATTAAAAPTGISIGSGLTLAAGALALASIVGPALFGNASTAAAAPGTIAIGTGLSLNAGGTLLATSSGGIATITAGAGLTTSIGTFGGSLTSNGTVIPILQINNTGTAGTGYTIQASDLNKMVRFQVPNNGTVVIPTPGTTFPAGWTATIINATTQQALVEPASATIDGVGTIWLQPSQGFRITTDGTNWFSDGLRGLPIVNSPTTSGGPILSGVSNSNASSNNPAWIISGTGGTISGNSLNSAILTGYNNQLNGAYGVICGGSANTIASGAQYCCILGSNNTVGGSGGGVAIGNAHSITGYFAGAIGQSMTMSGTNALGFGNHGVDRGNYNALVYGNGVIGGVLVGAQQWENHLLVAYTTGTVAVRLTANNSGASTNNVANLGSNLAAWMYCDLVIYDRTTFKGNLYNLSSGAAVSQSGAASTFAITSGVSFVAAGTLPAGGLTLAAGPTISADTTNGAPNISFTPPAGNTDGIVATAHVQYKIA